MRTPQSVDISAEAGPHFENRRVSRGLAFGDIDNDGDLDVLVANNNLPATLLRNEVGQDNDWIGFQLRGTRSNRDSIGARVELRLGEQLRRAEVRSGTSYLSQHDLRLVFGAGGDRLLRVEIDRSGDGRPERILRYSGGRISAEARDADGDGRLDTFDRFDPDGNVDVREEDLDGDGGIDVRSIYEAGRLVRRELSKPGDT